MGSLGTFRRLQGKKESRWLVLAQRVTLVAGVLLLAVWAVAWLHGRLGSRRAIARFEAARSRQAAATPVPKSAAAPTAVPTDVDTSLWSPKRIQGYRASLEHDFGLPLGVLRIPSLDLVVPIHAGTDELTLNRAVGWIDGTAKPDSDGNVGLAAHRDGFFRVLKDIQVGAPIVVETLEGSREYRVVDLSIVDPSDVGVLAPRSVPAVTLVTCYPFYFVGSAPQRFIVHAELSQKQVDTAAGRDTVGPVATPGRVPGPALAPSLE